MSATAAAFDQPHTTVWQSKTSQWNGTVPRPVRHQRCRIGIPRALLPPKRPGTFPGTLGNPLDTSRARMCHRIGDRPSPVNRQRTARASGGVAFTCAWPDRHRPNSMCRTSLGRSIATAACLGLARFDGHPPSGVLPRRGCPSWRPWNVRSLARAGRSRPSPRPRSSSLCQRGDRSIGQVARDFDLTETSVREWVRQAERDAGTRGDGGLTSAERQELSALRRENRRLRQDVEILKRATAFFVKETR
jgi:transposase